MNRALCLIAAIAVALLSHSADALYRINVECRAAEGSSRLHTSDSVMRGSLLSESAPITVPSLVVAVAVIHSLQPLNASVVVTISNAAPLVIGGPCDREPLVLTGAADSAPWPHTITWRGGDISPTAPSLSPSPIVAAPPPRTAEHHGSLLASIEGVKGAVRDIGANRDLESTAATASKVEQKAWERYDDAAPQPSPQKRAAVIGAVELKAALFHPRPLPWAPNALHVNLTQLDLPANIRAAIPGAFRKNSLGQCAQARAELFLPDGTPLSLAQHPNKPTTPGVPWDKWMKVSAVGVRSDLQRRLHRTCDLSVDTGLRSDSVPFDASTSAAEKKFCLTPETQVERRFHDTINHRRTVVGRDSDRTPLAVDEEPSMRSADETRDTFQTPDRLPRPISQAALRSGTVWAHGYWAYDWADSYIRIKNISSIPTGASSATIGGPTPVGAAQYSYDPATPPLYHLSRGARFYVVNALELMDTPGEYFIEADGSGLYVIPPAGTKELGAPALFLSVVKGALISAMNVRNVVFENIDFKMAIGSGLSVRASDNVLVSSVSSGSMGQHGIILSDSTNSVLSNVASTFCGCGAVSMSGGVMESLLPSNVSLIGGDISRYARWTRTYNAGVGFYGVGVTIARVTVAHAPHQGMTGSGNNHLFTRNTFEHLCFEVRDSSAFYVGRSWVHRGMMLHANTFRYIRALEPTDLGSDSVQAIYFDDQFSGISAHGNLITDSHAGFLIGGGRDVYVTGNRCERIDAWCVLFDARGLGWQRETCFYNATTHGPLVGGLFAVHYQRPPYSVAYPALPPTLQQWPCYPYSTAVVSNTYCNVTKAFMDVSVAQVSKWKAYTGDNQLACP